MKKICVGSKNPVKVAAVENVIKTLWPDAEVVALDVSSGVSEQPRSDDESIQGATHRAKQALEKSGADLGIGLEGGVADTKHGMFVIGWAAVIDKNGTLGLGCGSRLMLPEKIACEIRKGGELGPVMDAFIGQHNTKQKHGTVGILTNGLVSRTAAFEKSVTLALAKFMNPHFYE